METMSDDITRYDRQAVAASVEVVRHATPADLPRPTPCAGWTLDDLLAHMAAQHRGFAAAAGGNGADPATWAVDPDPGDRLAEYGRSADRVVAAFAAGGVLDRTFHLAGFPPPATFPGAVAIGFHTVDYVVHTWDVARALGRDWRPDPGLARRALVLAGQVPDGPPRLEPGAAFAPVLPSPDGAVDLDRVLALLGRSPGWSPGE
jgi:uncharacterized protein (TIGR03086 family)